MLRYNFISEFNVNTDYSAIEGSLRADIIKRVAVYFDTLEKILLAYKVTTRLHCYPLRSGQIDVLGGPIFECPNGTSIWSQPTHIRVTHFLMISRPKWVTLMCFDL